MFIPSLLIAPTSGSVGCPLAMDAVPKKIKNRKNNLQEEFMRQTYGNIRHYKYRKCEKFSRDQAKSSHGFMPAIFLNVELK